jgi:hypothetical protein
VGRIVTVVLQVLLLYSWHGHSGIGIVVGVVVAGDVSTAVGVVQLLSIVAHHGSAGLDRVHGRCQGISCKWMEGGDSGTSSQGTKR